jgi:Tfp pilus assembly protein PilO
MIWREKRALLIVLGVLLLANILFFLTYRVRYQQRLEDLDSRKVQAQAQLDQAIAHRNGIQAQLAAYARVQHDIQTVYDERWSTQKKRLSAIIIETERLAAASQLHPKGYSFSQDVQKDASLNASAISASSSATVVHIAFNVQGTYQQVRRLINLIELSDEFMIIDQLSLATAAEENSGVINLTIRIKTLFRDPKVESPQSALPRDVS